MSAAFRYGARRSGDVIPRRREGPGSLALRLVFASALYLSLLAYMVNPAWMAWSSFSLPLGIRWVGVALGLAMLPLLAWVFRSLGSNISETVLTKEHHALVTHGPYRWVRHPLYSVATTMFLMLGVVAANWFIIGTVLLAIAGIAVSVIPREEAQLIARFGDRYRAYQAQTGMLLPRFRSPRRA